MRHLPVSAPAVESHASLPLSPKVSDVDAKEANDDLAFAPTERVDAPPPSNRAATVLPPPEAVPDVSAPRMLEPTVRRRPPRAKMGKPIIAGIAVAAVLAIGATAFAVHAFTTKGPESPPPPPRVAQFVDEPPPATSAPAPPPPVAFDRDAAALALDGAKASLAECKLPKAKPVRVKMTFTSSGAVSSANALPPITAKQASCVSKHLESVKVPAFDGPPASYIHTFAAK